MGRRRLPVSSDRNRELTQFADAVVASFAAPFETPERSVDVTVSVGAAWSARGCDAESLLTDAEQALSIARLPAAARSRCSTTTGSTAPPPVVPSSRSSPRPSAMASSGSPTSHRSTCGTSACWRSKHWCVGTTPIAAPSRRRSSSPSPRSPVSSLRSATGCWTRPAGRRPSGRVRDLPASASTSRRCSSWTRPSRCECSSGSRPTALARSTPPRAHGARPRRAVGGACSTQSGGLALCSASGRLSSLASSFRGSGGLVPPAGRDRPSSRASYSVAVGLGSRGRVRPGGACARSGGSTFPSSAGSPGRPAVRGPVRPLRPP